MAPAFTAPWQLTRLTALGLARRACSRARSSVSTHLLKPRTFRRRRENAGRPKHPKKQHSSPRYYSKSSPTEPLSGLELVPFSASHGGQWLGIRPTPSNTPSTCSTLEHSTVTRSPLIACVITIVDPLHHVASRVVQIEAIRGETTHVGGRAGVKARVAIKTMCDASFEVEPPPVEPFRTGSSKILPFSLAR